ncbi:pentatricopeptide repeat-containing protein, partial [Tanacetum coccineum]
CLNMISLFPKEVTHISETVVANIGLKRPMSRGVTRFVIVREAARRTSYKRAIASSRAPKIYGLDILAQNIHVTPTYHLCFSDYPVIEKGVWIHGQILERGLECDVFIAAGLVDLYCKCGRLVDARKVFDKMWDKDVAVWNAMVAGTKMWDKTFGKLGDLGKVSELLREMESRG